MQTSLRPGGPTLTLPDYWAPLGTLPDDPPDARAVTITFRDGATGFLMMHPIPPDEAKPLDQQDLIDRLRGADEALADQAGRRALQIRNGFDEGDLTGPRESLVYEIAQRHTRLQEPPKGDPIAIARFAKEVSGSLGECRRTWWSSFE